MCNLTSRSYWKHQSFMPWLSLELRSGVVLSVWECMLLSWALCPQAAFVQNNFWLFFCVQARRSLTEPFPTYSFPRLDWIFLILSAFSVTPRLPRQPKNVWCDTELRDDPCFCESTGGTATGFRHRPLVFSILIRYDSTWQCTLLFSWIRSHHVSIFYLTWCALFTVFS